MTIIKIKNSSIAGKQPSADQIEVAELALNLVDAALYTKDAAGNIIRLDSATSSGDTDSRPTNPTIGDLYYDTEIEALLYWDGTGWKEITDAGPINLGYTAAADKGTVTNTGGDDAELPLVDAANAGLMSPEDFDKLVDTGKITTDDGTPGTPNANDLWIDTSVCPPEIKIYSDCDNPGDFNWVSIGGGTPTPAITFTAAITDTGADGNQVGKILTAEAQNISGGNDPVESSYQWYVDGTASSTAKTRLIQVGDVGLTITCDITVSERATNANPVTERATYAKTPSLAASISKPVVMTPPDGAGIGGDVTYTPKTSAVTSIEEIEGWTTTSIATNFGNVVYGNNRYVALKYYGSGPVAYYSDDGEVWNASVTTNNITLEAFGFDGTKFVAIGDSGLNSPVLASLDGITWTQEATLPRSSWHSIASGLATSGPFGGQIVAITVSKTTDNILGAKIHYSTDAIVDWYECNEPYGGTSTAVQGVAYNNGRWVAVANSGGAIYSDGGLNWSEETTIETNARWADLIYANNEFLAVTSTSKIYSSPDGETWQYKSEIGSNNIESLAYSGSSYVAVGQSKTIFYSTDAINWSKVLPVDGTSLLRDVCYGPDGFVAVGEGGTSNIISSETGLGESTTLTLTNSNTYNNADGSAMSAPISQTFLAGQTVSGVSTTGTYGTDTPAFSTALYTGNGTEQTITNGIDLADGGGLVWLKTRARAVGDFYCNHMLYDSERGLNDSSYLHTNTNEAQGAMGAINPPISFLSDGFTAPGTSNQNTETYVSWTFRRAPGFFDIVTWTGDGTDKAYAHSLGTKPGCMIVKNTNETINWQVYHQDLGHGYPLVLNAAAGVQSGEVFTISSAEPTASEFSVGGGVLNVSGYEYVAYLFAETPGKIKCDSYTVDQEITPIDIECGFKPGWVMIKCSSSAADWVIFDTKRDGNVLSLNSNVAEYDMSSFFEFTNTGFKLTYGAGTISNMNETYIYVAIAEDVVAGGLPPTGTLTADADDAGPTITLSGVTGAWEAGMEVVSDTEITEFGPGADVLQFVSTTPAGASITTYGQATWEVDTDANFDSPMTATKTITPGSNQELLPSERGAITLADDTEYHVRVKYDSADPSGVESAYSDVNQFKTGAGQDGWNAIAAPEANSWQSVTYGNGKFVAISSDGTNRVMYSTDGMTWNAAASVPASNVWQSVTYGNDKFVAVSADTVDAVMYSTDGITWNSSSGIAENGGWYSVTYGNGKFVAVSSGGTKRMMYSTDGITWNAVPVSIDSGWSDVTYADGKFVAVAANGATSGKPVMYSTDGITWNAASGGVGIESGWMSVTYGNGKFVAVAWTGTNRVMYSTNADKWYPADAAEPNGWYSVTYGNGKFVAVSYNGTNPVMYSTDGVNWSASSAPESNYWYAVTYGGGKFVAVGQTGTNRVMRSETGVSDPARFTAFDADNNKPVNDLNIIDRYGVDPTADNTHLGIYELTNQPTDAVAAYVPEGDKYKPIIDLSQPLEQAQAEAAQANARLDEANATIETMRSNFEERISALENPNTKTASTKTAKKK